MTNMYYTYPATLVAHKMFVAEVGVSYEIECHITDVSAYYTVNGEMFATCEYARGVIPEKGYFGFARYNPGEIKAVRNVKITYDKPYDIRKMNKAMRKTWSTKLQEQQQRSEAEYDEEA